MKLIIRVSPTDIEDKIRLMRQIPMAHKIRRNPHDSHEIYMSELKEVLNHNKTINYLNELHESLTGSTCTAWP